MLLINIDRTKECLVIFDIWYGKEDKNIHREKIEKWRECTNGNVKIEEMAGGHFFVDIEKQCICEMINQKLLEVQ